MLEEKLEFIGGATYCAIAVLIKNNAVLLGMRHYTPDKWKTVSVWTSPGGRCDEGESIEQTLRRETKEEVNISDLSITHFIGEVPGAKEGDKVLIFACGTNQEPTLMEPEKFSEWRWVPVEEYFKGEPWNLMNPEAYRVIKEFLISRPTRDASL
jgi:ADP-ribose pyrophosphatase YjhB (NUDIX family)